MNGYQFVTNYESSKNKNVKFEINKLSTNKRGQFLENNVPVNDTLERNPNGYCNVDFVFTLKSNKCLLYCGIMVLSSIMNLHLFLKRVSSDIKSLSRCGLTCVVSVIFCTKTFTFTEVARVMVNASNKELQVCVW